MPDPHQTFPQLTLDRPSEGVAVLTLDNPDQRNAMSEEMTASWVAAVDQLAGDRSLRVVVVTGSGSAFCSGGNTGWIASEPDAGVDHLRTRMIAFYRAWLSIRRLEVPTVAAVNGPAIGAGLCLALACDLRYAAGSARLGAPFVRLGMNPGMAATYLLPDVVGEAHARELLITGRTVDADEALRLGLVSGVYDDATFQRGGARDRGRDRGDGPDREPLHHAGAAWWRPPGPRGRGAVGSARAADHAGDGRPPGGDPGRAREAATGVPRRLRRSRGRGGQGAEDKAGHKAGHKAGPPMLHRRLPSPCERR